MSNKEVIVRADCHVWAHSKSSKRFEETFEALKWSYEEAVDRGIKHVIDAGDLFHDRIFLDVYIYNRVYRLVKHYHDKHGIMTHLLLGNHDMYFRHRQDVSSIVSFEHFGNVIDKAGTYEINGVECDFLPYSETNPVSDMINEIFSESKSDLLFFHAAINGAIVNSRKGIVRKSSVSEQGESEMAEEEISDSIDPDAFSGWKFAFGGHYHYPQVVCEKPCRVEYIGSPIQHSFGESTDRKRILVMDLSNPGDYEEIVNDFSPRFEVIDLSQDDIGDIDRFENCRVRLITPDRGSDQIRKLRKDLINAGAIEVYIKSTAVEQIDKQMHRATLNNATNIIRDGRRMVNTYATLQSPAHLDMDYLIKVGEEIVDRSDGVIKDDEEDNSVVFNKGVVI